MTHYLPVYDVEFLQDIDYSLRALKSVVRVHRRRQAPATFCICGALLEQAGARYAELLRDDLFDIHSHTYTHMMLKRANDAEPPIDMGRAREELVRTAELLQRWLGVTSPGVRTPNGFYRGLREAAEILSLLAELGIPFVSSDLRAFEDTIPAPLTEPYWYDEDGFPQILELPSHDWHDNVLKGYTAVPCGWPPVLPWGYPSRPPQTPEQEFEIYRKGLHGAVEREMTYYSPGMHPWSIYRFHPEARTVELILEEAARMGMPITTFSFIHHQLRAQREATQ